MKVLIIKIDSFGTIQLDNVSNIAFASGSFTVTASGVSQTFSTDSYKLQILW